MLCNAVPGTSRNVSPSQGLCKVGRASLPNSPEHLLSRYGIDEVSQWVFLKYGKRAQYRLLGRRIPSSQPTGNLYDHTSRGAVSEPVNPRLRIAGPATAQSPPGLPTSIPALRRSQGAPSTLVSSSRSYGNDGGRATYSATHRRHPAQPNGLPLRGKRFHDQIQASAKPKTPPLNLERIQTPATRTKPDVDRLRFYMGPWLADTIRQCDGLG